MSIDKLKPDNFKSIDDIKTALSSIKSADSSTNIDISIFNGLDKKGFEDLVNKSKNGDSKESIFFKEIDAVGADNVFTMFDADDSGRIEEKDYTTDPKSVNTDNDKQHFSSPELQMVLYNILMKSLEMLNLINKQAEEKEQDDENNGIASAREYQDLALYTIPSGQSYYSLPAPKDYTPIKENYVAPNPPPLSEGIKNTHNAIISTASKYMGYNENDDSYKKFTNGRTEAWCADFVSTVVKETYKNEGKQLPAGFGSASVQGLQSWAKDNKSYLDTSGMNTSQKQDFIKKSVNVGDVIVWKQNGASHVAFVGEIGKDGTITTVEGNWSNKVTSREVKLNGKYGVENISGFISLR